MFLPLPATPAVYPLRIHFPIELYVPYLGQETQQSGKL